MSWVDNIKEGLPDYAKDTKLNLDAVINRSTIDVEQANGIALAAAMATGNGKLVSFIQTNMENATERDAALTAARAAGKKTSPVLADYAKAVDAAIANRDAANKAAEAAYAATLKAAGINP